MRTVIDVDDEALEAAAVELGTRGKRETVNAALRYAAERKHRAAAVADADLLLGGSDIGDPEVMAGARR